MNQLKESNPKQDEVTKDNKNGSQSTTTDIVVSDVEVGRSNDCSKISRYQQQQNENERQAQTHNPRRNKRQKAWSPWTLKHTDRPNYLSHKVTPTLGS